MADTADNSVTVSFSADTSGFQTGVNQVNAALTSIGTTANATSNVGAQLFRSMERASDQMVVGILRGTQTWQQAMRRLFSNILAAFINDMVVNPLLQWTAAQLGMTQATISGNAARTASNQTASTSGIAAQAQQAMAAISTDAAQVFGGVYAFLAPELGPAASGPAASSEAQVLSQMSMVSLDVGAWNVPGNMPAFLHAGEMVVPENFASGLRGGSLGGDSYTINISAIDTQTGAQFLKNNASVIASTLSSQVRSFNRSVPAWKS